MFDALAAAATIGYGIVLKFSNIREGLTVEVTTTVDQEKEQSQTR